jgi:predicted kinase
VPYQPPRLPRTLLAMKGHPATGKSTVANALARRLRWPLIDKDDAKDHLLDITDAETANARSYAIMWQVARTQLQLGSGAIAVSPLTYPEQFARAQQVARQGRARLLVVETVLAEEEWRRRLEARSPAASAHKIRGWEAMQATLARYDGCYDYPIPPGQHVVVDAARPVQAVVDEIIERMKRQEFKG